MNAEDVMDDGAADEGIGAFGANDDYQLGFGLPADVGGDGCKCLSMMT